MKFLMPNYTTQARLHKQNLMLCLELLLLPKISVALQINLVSAIQVQLIQSPNINSTLKPFSYVAVRRPPSWVARICIFA